MDQHTTDKRKAKKTMETNSSEAKRDVKNVKLNHSHSDQYGSSLFRYNCFFFAYVRSVQYVFGEHCCSFCLPENADDCNSICKEKRKLKIKSSDAHCNT